MESTKYAVLLYDRNFTIVLVKIVEACVNYNDFATVYSITKRLAGERKLSDGSVRYFNFESPHGYGI